MDRTLQGLASDVLVQAYAAVEAAMITSPDSGMTNPYRGEILRRLEQVVNNEVVMRQLTGISRTVAIPGLGKAQKPEYGQHVHTLLHMLEAAAN